MPHDDPFAGAGTGGSIDFRTWPSSQLSERVTNVTSHHQAKNAVHLRPSQIQQLVNHITTATAAGGSNAAAAIVSWVSDSRNNCIHVVYGI